MQCFVALALGIWGVLGLQGSFLPIRTTEVLGQQCVWLHLAWPAALSFARSCFSARDRLFRNAPHRTIDSLEPGPDFQHFRTREHR